ncbi:hypothetical protein GRI97_02635 [Altererythrobacter xixiisoli]|uniref:Uncharacterized protein n=1 Tax=Croceibacterium xixiisoli TaxID=1476466 RepID=A0A6I4TP77_9SPHN|nr:hypothetical protein [Croceibacterium xixiisoli]MXO97885.1 hypothetical protein [Croceibacterium xixiisoli]
MLGGGEPRREPLRVGVMAVALVVAAFTGAALGMAWQKFDAGDSAAQNQAASAQATPAGQN